MSQIMLDGSLADQFMSTIPRAMQSIRSEMRSKRLHDLSVPHFRILAKLWRAPANNKTLAEHLGVSVAAMSRMVDSLVNRGLIARSMGEEDRREVKLELTPVGRESFSEIRQKTRQNIALRLELLSEIERVQLNQGLELITKLLEG